MNRTAFLIAAVLTAFVLVVSGGLVANLTSAQAAGVAPAEQQRDAEWRQLLAQANERLQQAYADPAPASSAQTDDIGALGAEQAALLVAPEGRLLRPPERVDFEGVVAYEVLFDQGPVYVDAATGQVLYDGTNTAQFSSGDGEHDDDEGEDEHDEHSEHETEDGHGEHDDDDD
ncbi:MAG: hypothetical protein IT318_22230 [Anaerolineales bacterium]|nr:hypothetical protein [Anaerolineales bacterium]